MTYRKLYEEGCCVLKDIPDGKLDARLLLEEACSTNLQTMLLSPERIVSTEEEQRYRTFLARRKAHEPLAMIVGHAGFMGMDFFVTKDVLIPEQDTEILVETALQLARNDFSCILQNKDVTEYLRGKKAKTWKVLDLCTGTGCIIMSLLEHLFRVDHSRMAGAYVRAEAVATDLSSPALEVACRNAFHTGWHKDHSETGRIFYKTFAGDSFTLPAKGTPCTITAVLKLFQGDLFKALPQSSAGAGFDMIVSNPPYIAETVIPTLAPEVKNGEPYMALCGGRDGLDFYRRIAKEAPAHLRAGGSLLLEIGFDQADAVCNLLLEAGFTQIQVLRDYGGNDRVVTAVAPEKGPQ